MTPTLRPPEHIGLPIKESTGRAERTPAFRLEEVCVRRQGRFLLDGVNWRVEADQRWVLLGPNGSGKTTLLRVAGAQLWPTSGTVEVLGCQLGRVDVRSLRRRVALVSGAVIRQLRPALTAREVVVSAKYGALEAWWNRFSPSDWEAADRLLEAAGVGGPGGVGERAFGVISEGERQQVLLARALMSRPDLLLLDEPAAGLDLGARERLLERISALTTDAQSPPLVMVTHHVEEVPKGITHAGLIRDGRLIAAGPIEETLTSGIVSECFGVSVTIGYEDGRWWSRAR